MNMKKAKDYVEYMYLWHGGEGELPLDKDLEAIIMAVRDYECILVREKSHE